MPGQLSKELGKRKSFESLRQELTVSVLRTNDDAQYKFRQFFREYALSQQQFNILWILGDEGGPLPSLELAKRMITRVPAITSLLDKLEKKEYVSRRRCEQDRRVWHVALTQKGQELLETMSPPNLEMHEHLHGHLSDKECQQLIALLAKARSR